MEKLEEKAAKKLKEGWIRSRMMIEVLAVTEDAAKSALEKHTKKLEEEDGVLVYKKEFYEIKKIEQPTQAIKEAYSHIVEIELLTVTYEKLVFIAMNYGPSSIEILEPKELKIDMGEAQGILNSIADMIHNFARSGVGGVIIRT